MKSSANVGRDRLRNVGRMRAKFGQEIDLPLVTAGPMLAKSARVRSRRHEFGRACSMLDTIWLVLGLSCPKSSVGRNSAGVGGPSCGQTLANSAELGPTPENFSLHPQNLRTSSAEACVLPTLRCQTKAAAEEALLAAGSAPVGVGAGRREAVPAGGRRLCNGRAHLGADQDLTLHGREAVLGRAAPTPTLIAKRASAQS